MPDVKAAPPQLRRWTPPLVEVSGAVPPDADLPDVAALAVPVAPARAPGHDGTPGHDGAHGHDGAAGDAGVEPRPGAADAAVRYGLDLAEACALERVTGRAGQVTRLPVPAPAGSPRALYVVGVGDSTPQDLRRAAAALARAVRPEDDVATTLADGAGPEGTRAVVEGFLLASYVPPRAGLRVAEEPARGRLLLLGRVEEQEVRRAVAGATATVLARDLAATPSNLKDPGWFADQARTVAREHGLEVEVLTADRLRAEGFGGLLAVGGGSASPPCLVQVAYRPKGPGARTAPHVVLVGKGITFDSGGLSLKPREAMVAMKTDMAGAAAVLAVLSACGALGVRARVTALLPLAENALAASSYRPGDVVTHHGGRTSEVANTDAEGRMVLADALAYADAELDPDVVVDIATLTGAAALGLGKRHGALFTADEELAAGLLAAGESSGERLWRMPLVDDYAGLVESPIADVRQVSADPHAGAGAIVAALFLRRFAGRRRWAHLDVAGPARAESAEHEVVRGATGFGARVLLSWLQGFPPRRPTARRAPARKPGPRRA